MSGASDTLDPVEAAEDDIAGSKDLIASVADEISQHQRWLENYRVSETKRARRLRRQELMYQLEIRRRRTIRSAKRFALASLILARQVASFLARNGTALLVTLRRLLSRCAAWTAPRARALALALGRWSSAAWSWTWLKAGILARASLRAGSIGASWIAVKSRALGLALRTWLYRQLSEVAAWSRVNARILARASRRGASTGFAWTAKMLQSSLSTGAVWTSATAHSLARGSLATASAGFSGAALNVRGLSLNARRAKRETDSRHRALVVRRSTALVCIAPLRARLPVLVRAS